MLKGNIIGLRAIENEDLISLLKWRNNPEYRQYFREYRELNLEQQKKWFENIVQKNTNTIMFSIINLKSSQLLGTCGLCRINWIHKNADFSIYIGKENKYIDSTFAPDAAKTLIKYGFNELGMHKLWAEIYDFDKKKKQLLNSLGFQLEGTHKETYWYNGKWHNSLFYGILDESNNYLAP